MDLTFWISKIWQRIRNERPKNPVYTNSHENWTIFKTLDRHFEFSKSDRGFVISIPENPYIQVFIKMENFSKLRSAIVNFENLTTDSKSATSKIPKCQLLSEYDILFNLQRTQQVILTHTLALTENSVQIFQKKVRPWPYCYSSLFEKKNFANFFKCEKDFRGTYNIYKLLKQCWKYTSEFLWVKGFSSCGIISDQKWTGSNWPRVFTMMEKIGVSSKGRMSFF